MDIDAIVSIVNSILFGMLISLTIRWVMLHYSAYKLKSNQKGPLDRMIEIPSEEILFGVIRKRRKQVKLIMDSSMSFDTKGFDDKPQVMPKATSEAIRAIYQEFKKNGFSIALIPNEDVYLAQKRSLLDSPFNYYLNDEIVTRLSNSEIIAIKSKELKEKKDKEAAFLEKQRKLKEQQVEDSIKI